MTDVDVPRLEAIAQQLAARVRDEDPDTVAQWLNTELPNPADWFRLAFVLAAAVPDDKRWSDLIRWIDRPDPIDYRRTYARHWKRQARATAREASDAA